MSLQEYDLDEPGLAYVLDHLRGVNTLCEGLARAVERNGGRVFTLAPNDTDASRLYEFRTGGLLAENSDGSRAVSLGHGKGSLMPVASLMDPRAAMIMKSLVACPGSVCVCDDFNPRWPDEIASDCSTAFGVGQETYHLLTAEDGLSAIADVLSLGNAVWHGVAAVCRQGLRVQPGREVDKDAMMEWATSAIELSCAAYDGEGFVVWQRR